MKNIDKAIYLIYPEFSGSFTFWQKKPDGSDWANPIDGLTWENTELAKPTWSQIETALATINAAEELEALKKARKDALQETYDTAQNLILQNGHTFYIPLKGSAFDLIQNQYFSAQARGFAPLRWPDSTGVVRTLRDLPATVWQSFYTTAKGVSEDNWMLKEDITAEIDGCVTAEAIAAINVNQFPAVQTIQLDIPA